jgi:paraquat-inducible protein A
MARPRHRDPLTGLMLLGALVLLGLGLWLPALTVQKLWLFDSTTSIAGAIGTLFAQGHVVLAVVVTAFSIVFPVVKLALSLRIWLARDPSAPGVRRALAWTVTLGKWSMLDVFMAAIVVAILTLGVIASVEPHPGLYVFGGAIVVAMMAAHRLEAALAGPAGGEDA